MVKIKKEKGELIKFGEEFTAFNDNGLNNFISVDEDYSELFGGDNFRENTLYGKANKDNFNTSDISSDEDEYVDNYNNHNVDKEFYYKVVIFIFDFTCI